MTPHEELRRCELRALPASSIRTVWAQFVALPSIAVRLKRPRGATIAPMAETFLRRAARAAAPDDRLDSWKEIAAYLNRDVTTVQRWEKARGDAGPPARSRQAGFGLCLSVRAGRLDTQPQPAADGRDVARASSRASAPDIARRIEAIDGSRGPWPRRRCSSALAATWWQLERRDYFWRNPLDDAQFQNVTDFGGDRTGGRDFTRRQVRRVPVRSRRTDGRLGHAGRTGQSYNLTHGRFQELVNPSLRTLGFSPDATLVTFWTRGSRRLGPRGTSASGRYQRSAASRSRTWKASPSSTGRATARAWSTTRPDPGIRCSSGLPERKRSGSRSLWPPPGLHAHFPVVVAGRRVHLLRRRDRSPTPWTSGASGRRAEPPSGSRYHNSRVSHPVLLNDRTLMYLATDTDGSGPWLYTTGRRASRAAPRWARASIAIPLSRRAPTDAGSLQRSRIRTGTLWRLADRRHAGRRLGSAPISLDDGPWIRAATWSGLPAVCFVEGDERWHLEARRTERRPSCGAHRRANHRRARDRTPTDVASPFRSRQRGGRCCT